jgi:hypothetical protein
MYRKQPEMIYYAMPYGPEISEIGKMIISHCSDGNGEDRKISDLLKGHTARRRSSHFLSLGCLTSSLEYEENGSRGAAGIIAGGWGLVQTSQTLHQNKPPNYSQEPSYGNSQHAPPLTNGLRKCGIYTQWNFMQP